MSPQLPESVLLVSAVGIAVGEGDALRGVESGVGGDGGRDGGMAVVGARLHVSEDDEFRFPIKAGRDPMITL